MFCEGLLDSMMIWYTYGVSHAIFYILKLKILSTVKQFNCSDVSYGTGLLLQP